MPRTIAHRPYAPPERPWALRQTWYELLFAHWALPSEAVRAVLPRELELDTFARQAWVGVVPFGMRGVAPRALPALPWLSRFLELNLRTYVVHRGRPGVYFWSLDAANPLAVELARRWFHLNYLRARMHMQRQAEWIAYESERQDARARPAVLRVRYRGTGEVFHAAPGTLEDFLVNRYCLYTLARGRVLRGEIHHAPWPLQRAEAEIAENTLAEAAGLALPAEPPHLLYARELEVVAWAPVEAGV